MSGSMEISSEELVSEGPERLPKKLGVSMVDPRSVLTLDQGLEIRDLGYDFSDEEDGRALDHLGAHEQQRAAEASVDADQVSEIKRVTWQKQLSSIPRKQEEVEVEESLKTNVAELGLDLLDITDATCSAVTLNPPSLGSTDRKVLEDMDHKDELRQGRTLNHGDSKSGTILGTRPPASRSASPQEMQDLVQDMHEKNKLLEAAMKAKSMEIETLKQEFQERENDLLDQIECLELANEQLLAGGENSGMEQLQMELTRLQKQNTMLAQRERELQFQLSTKDMLQKEVQHLQELNEQLLHTRLAPDDCDTGAESKMLERIVTLETELAEAMEVNNLYRSQLQTAFVEQEKSIASQAATTAVVTSSPTQCAADEQTLQQLRLQVKEQGSELQEIRDRFYIMSIRLAETEAQHEEALMKVKRLQNPLRNFTGSFKL